MPGIRLITQLNYRSVTLTPGVLLIAEVKMKWRLIVYELPE
jgi:hypothetical protein